MPDRFFHYCAVDSEARRSWLERMLVDNQIYFRDRTQLNDPDELRPSVVFEGSNNELHKFVRGIIQRHSPVHLSPARRLREESRIIRQYQNDTNLYEAILHNSLDKIGILSLSESSTDPLLWAHYADGHRGICIEFDANVGLFQAAQEVTYTNQRPIIRQPQDGAGTLIEKSMLTKGEAWRSEQEWRIIARWGDEERIRQYIAQHTLTDELRAFMEDQHGQGYYSFPVNAIYGVILGSRFDQEAEVWLRSVVDRMPQAISMTRA